jgi:hypothetical protein
VALAPLSRDVRKAYIAANGVALLITLAAGLVNVVVGPRAPVIFLVIPCQIVFALLNFAAANFVPRFILQSHPQIPPAWTRHAPRSPEEIERQMRTLRTISLIFVPAFFLLVSIALFFAAVAGRINATGAM